MKVAIFTDVFLEVSGGIPSSITAQREYLEKNGVKSVVFCPARPGSQVPKGVFAVPSFCFFRPGGAPFAKRIKKVKEAVLKAYPEFNFDIVHVHYEGACSLAGMQLAKEFKRPLVQTMHGREDVAAETNIPHPFKTLGGILICRLHKFGMPHPLKIRRDNYLAPTLVRAKMWTLMVNHANFADVVITPSKHFKEKLQHYGVTKPFFVISNAISDEDLKRSFAAAGLDFAHPETRTYDGKEPLRLFWNSRVSKEKRIMPFLMAMREIKTPVSLEVYGDGNELKKAKRYTKKHQLPVHFHGRVEHAEILKHMAKAQLSTVVSFGFDNQPMTILEARAMGLPTLICDPDLMEVTGKGGMLARNPEPIMLARAIDGLSRHPGYLAYMSNFLITHRSEILQSTQIKKLIKLYQTLLSNS